MHNVILEGRCKWGFWSLGSTTYALTDDYLKVVVGYVSSRRDTLQLYEILDVDFDQSVSQKLFFKTGDVKIKVGTDSGNRWKVIKNVPNPEEFTDTLLDISQKVRRDMGISIHQSIGGYNGDAYRGGQDESSVIGNPNSYKDEGDDWY